MNKISKRIALILFGLLLSVFLLETVLQIAAYVTLHQAKLQKEDPDRLINTPGEGVVICVGDSFTYGTGSSCREKTYPAQVEQYLNGKTQRTWSLINKGWPGRNSAEVMQRLPGLLKKYKPNYVCLLVGKNNNWSDEDMDLPAPDFDVVSGLDMTTNEEWEWKFRTKRLIALAWLHLTEEKNAEGDDLKSNVGGLEKKSAKIEKPKQKKGTTENKKPESFALSKEHRILMKAKNLVKMNDGDGAIKLLQEVAPKIETMNDPSLDFLYIQILFSLQRFNELIEKCLIYIEKHGKTMKICYLMVDPLARLGRLDEALHYANETIRLNDSDQMYGGFYVARSLVYKLKGDFPLMLKDIIQAYVITRDREFYEKYLRKVKSKRELADRLPEILDSLFLDGEVRKEAEEIAYSILGPAQNKKKKQRINEITKRHISDLRLMVKWAIKSGAQPILLTYPWEISNICYGLRTVANEVNVPLIDMTPVYQKLLETEKREDYFIKDGHCNDAGYKIM